MGVGIEMPNVTKKDFSIQVVKGGSSLNRLYCFRLWWAVSRNLELDTGNGCSSWSGLNNIYAVIKNINI
jgi:hypothetical protein